MEFIVCWHHFVLLIQTKKYQLGKLKYQKIYYLLKPVTQMNLVIYGQYRYFKILFVENLMPVIRKKIYIETGINILNCLQWIDFSGYLNDLIRKLGAFLNEFFFLNIKNIRKTLGNSEEYT